MRITRLVAGTVTAGLLGLAPLAVAAPGHAADTWDTITVATPSATRLVYGDDFYVSVDVDGTDGRDPEGTSTLMAMNAGSTTWVPVATNTSAGSDFFEVKPRMNTTYKVVYTGYTDTDQGPNGDNYKPSESASFTVRVARRITYPSSGFVIKGKVKPDYGNKSIVIKVSTKKKQGFKAWKTISTTSTGTYKVTLPRRGGTWYWSFTVKGDSKYAAGGFLWRTWVS